MADWRELAKQVEAREASRRAPKAKGGRTGQREGARDESLIDQACRLYAPTWALDWWRRKGDYPLRSAEPLADGQALVRKVATPARVVRNARGAMMVPTGPGGADYHGVLWNGRRVAFEAKGSQSASLVLKRPDGRPTLKPAQAADVAATHLAGGLGGVLVRVRSKPRGRAYQRRWFWMRWPAWVAAVEDALEQGRASLGLEQLGGHGVEVQPLRGEAPDWLRAALAAEEQDRCG